MKNYIKYCNIFLIHTYRKAKDKFVFKKYFCHILS